MILEKLGMNLKKNTKTKVWWIKLAASIIISNFFFFILFSGPAEMQATDSSLPEGWVEAQVSAELLTPFHSGKKVLLINRTGRKKIEGVLQITASDQLGKITVQVKENEAHTLFQYENWEVLPYLKEMSFTANYKESHEIRY